MPVLRGAPITLRERFGDLGDGKIEPLAAGTNVEKIVGSIKVRGRFILCIDDKDGGGEIGLERPVHRVEEEKLAEAFATVSCIDGKTAYQGRRHLRIARELLSGLFWQLIKDNRRGGERVIATNRSLASMHADKAIGDVASGLLPGLLFEVSIERFDTARKSRPVMLIA